MSATLHFGNPGAGVPEAWQGLVRGLLCPYMQARTRADDCRLVSTAHDNYETGFVAIRLKVGSRGMRGRVEMGVSLAVRSEVGGLGASEGAGSTWVPLTL